MPIAVVTKVLPYALMAFVGVAGWSMNSVPLLAIVVLGTMGVAIGTSMATKPATDSDATVDLNAAEHGGHDAHHDAPSESNSAS